MPATTINTTVIMIAATYPPPAPLPSVGTVNYIQIELCLNLQEPLKHFCPITNVIRMEVLYISGHYMLDRYISIFII